MRVSTPSNRIFDLGPGFLDGVELGRIGRDKVDLRVGLIDVLEHPCVLMGEEVVHDHDIPGVQSCCELLPYKRRKVIEIRFRVDRRETAETIACNDTDHRHGFPTALDRWTWRILSP